MNDLMTKSFMSYVDLKKSALRDLEAGPDEVEMAAATASQVVDENLVRFLEEADKVREEMGSIREALMRLEAVNDESKSLHKPEPLKALRAKINADMAVVLKKARWIRSKLKDMDRANAENRRVSGFGAGTPIDRTRTSVTHGLRRKLTELMNDFQSLQERTQAEYKETVGRRYFTVTGEVPDEAVIDRIISNGDGEEVLQRAIQEHGRGKVLATLYEIQDRHEAAKEIESSLLELHQVFMDMTVLVEAQGEQLDDIEHNVVNASNYVKDGTKNLKTAKEHQRSSRKWLCIGIILLLIFVLVIIIPITTTLRSS